MHMFNTHDYVKIIFVKNSKLNYYKGLKGYIQMKLPDNKYLIVLGSIVMANNVIMFPENHLELINNNT